MDLVHIAFGRERPQHVPIRRKETRDSNFKARD